ncbi:hypothetical protein [Bordetella genomosp. 1]|uniref:hypothetical protein n=1 Tax=Bordetella genomosp. 1 TaxID=1395607 RepID=UPI00211AC327|nr:hypothetical protein [Bordetella genomosp. 1]
MDALNANVAHDEGVEGMGKRRQEQSGKQARQFGLFEKAFFLHIAPGINHPAKRHPLLSSVVQMAGDFIRFASM